MRLLEEFDGAKSLLLPLCRMGHGCCIACYQYRTAFRVYDFHSKYTKGETEYLVPSRLIKKRQGMCRNWLLQPTRFWDAVVLRVDVMLDEAGKGYVLEANTAHRMTTQPGAESKESWGYLPDLEKIFVGIFER